MSAPIAVDDELYVTLFAGTVYKFKQADGAIVSAQRSRATSAPVVVGKNVYLTQRADAGPNEKTSERVARVDLLVAVAVALILMALLFPAVRTPIGNAPRSRCENNLSQIAKACQVYETNKGYFPPEVVDHYGKQPPTAQIPWPALLLGNLDRGDLAQNLRNANGEWRVWMEVYVCPSNSPGDYAQTPLAYAANAGQANVPGSATMPGDWRDNGVFMPALDGIQPQRVTSVFISGCDGLNMTILLMETGRSDINWSGAFDEGPGTPNAIWKPGTPQTSINTRSGGKPTGQFASNHSGGALVVMTCTSTKFLSDTINPIVLDQLFTCNGAGARQPGTAIPNVQPPGPPPGALDK